MQRQLHVAILWWHHLETGTAETQHDRTFQPLMNADFPSYRAKGFAVRSIASITCLDASFHLMVIQIDSGMDPAARMRKWGANPFVHEDIFQPMPPQARHEDAHPKRPLSHQKVQLVSSRPDTWGHSTESRMSRMTLS